MASITRFLIVCVLSYTVTAAENTPLACPWDPNQTPTVEKISYINAQLWKALIDTDEKRVAVAFWEQSLLLQDWGNNEGDRTDIFVEFKHVSEMSQQFKENNIDVIVHETNFQTWIDQENPPLDETKLKSPSHNLTWERYHRLADIDSYLQYLATHYRKICTLRILGHSIENRPIRVLKISNGNRFNKAIWIDGGIHGREWISPAVVTYLINYIVLRFNKRTDLSKYDWYITPVLNPDGYEFSHTHDRLWRKNRRPYGSCFGVDLNRNFEYAWGQPGSSSCPCHDVYSGKGPFSEPEGRAVKTFIENTRRHKNDYWKAFLTFHSFGQVIFYVGDDLENLANKLTQAMESVNGETYNSIPSTNDPTPGGTDEWAKRIMNIKNTFTFELRDLGNRGFVLPYWHIVPNGEEAVAAILKMINS